MTSIKTLTIMVTVAPATARSIREFEGLFLDSGLTRPVRSVWLLSCSRVSVVPLLCPVVVLPLCTCLACPPVSAGLKILDVLTLENNLAILLGAKGPPLVTNPSLH